MEEDLTREIIAAAIEVHRQLGPGLLESTYQTCLAREFTLRGVSFQQQKEVPVEYKGVRVECGYRFDFLVAGRVILELKAVEIMHPVYEAQVLTYLRHTGCRVGLLINFNVPVLKSGIKRLSL